MSPFGQRIRHGQLWDALRFVRWARENLAAGDLPQAIRSYALAERTLAYMRGLEWSTSTATLTRVIARLSRDVEAAAVRPAPSDKELVEVLAEGIRVLRTRDGLPVDEEHVLERAKNMALPVRALFHA